MQRKKLLFNTAIMSSFSIIMSFIGLTFQVWLTGKIGAAGIGLFQLISSVSALGATFAISGIRFASTRLVAEEISDELGGDVFKAMRECLGYALFFGISACAIMWLLSDIIGSSWIKDARTAASIRIMAFSLPCIALSSAISGYFTACGRIIKPMLIGLFEQVSSIIIGCFLLEKAGTEDIAKSCAAISSGRLTGDVLALFIIIIVFTLDIRKNFRRKETSSPIKARMLKIALPLAASAYARSALSTVLHLFVPNGLKKTGLSAVKALEYYGIIQGMALPVILFPSCILLALAELIVPQLTHEQLCADPESIRKTVRDTIGKTVRSSLTVGLLFMLLSDTLGQRLYQSESASHYIRLLAPLVPVMYTDMVIDGCLKGLGKQLWCMLINILDVLSGLVIVILFLPRYGLSAYIGMIYFTEILNLTLSAFALKKSIRNEERSIKSNCKPDGVMV